MYPPRLALSVFAVELLSVLFRSPILAIFQLLDKSELLSVDSLLIQHISVRIRQGDPLRTKFNRLLTGILCHIPRPRYHHRLVFNGFINLFQHLFHKVKQPKSCCLSPDLTSAIREPLPCQYSREGCCQSFVLSEHITHLPDRKSTRLNSSHVAISYAVFCLKKKTHKNITK